MTENKILLYRSDLLRAAKGAKSLSLDAIAAETGIAVNTIRAALDGKNILIGNLRVIADFLGVGWSELFQMPGVMFEQIRQGATTTI
jgi:transcriptional regulator with XRE-family HTH domain